MIQVLGVLALALLVGAIAMAIGLLAVMILEFLHGPIGTALGWMLSIANLGLWLAWLSGHPKLQNEALSVRCGIVTA